MIYLIIYFFNVNDKFEITEIFHDYEDLFSPSIYCKVKTSYNDIFILDAFYRSDEENVLKFD